MSRIDDLLQTFRQYCSRTGEAELTDQAVELATAARGEEVTSRVLANLTGRSKRPLIDYMDADEQPEYVLRGNQIIIDNEDSYTTEYPTRETQVLITDHRLLIILGGRFSDDVWEISFEDVHEVYLDDEGWKQYLILDATREGESMVFFVDTTVEENATDLQSGIGYVRRRVA